MIRFFLLAVALVFSTTAFAAQQYCEVEENEEYGTRIVRIPYGIAIITEEFPEYCRLDQIGEPAADGSQTFGCSNHPDKFQILVQWVNGVENILMWDKQFVACEGRPGHNDIGTILSNE